MSRSSTSMRTRSLRVSPMTTSGVHVLHHRVVLAGAVANGEDLAGDRRAHLLAVDDRRGLIAAGLGAGERARGRTRCPLRASR